MFSADEGRKWEQVQVMQMGDNSFWEADGECKQGKTQVNMEEVKKPDYQSEQQTIWQRLEAWAGS